MALYLGPLRGPVGGRAPHTPSSCLTLGCLPSPHLEVTTHYARAGARVYRPPPVDNPAKPGDNLGKPPDTPVVRLTAGDGPVTYSVDMTTKTLRPCQVAELLGVARQTVHDYAAQGRLEFTRTPGGHRRYPVTQPLLQDALAAQDTAQ